MKKRLFHVQSYLATKNGKPVQGKLGGIAVGELDDERNLSGEGVATGINEANNLFWCVGNFLSGIPFGYVLTKTFDKDGAIFIRNEKKGKLEEGFCTFCKKDCVSLYDIQKNKSVSWSGINIFSNGNWCYYYGYSKTNWRQLWYVHADKKLSMVEYEDKKMIYCKEIKIKKEWGIDFYLPFKPFTLEIEDVVFEADYYDEDEDNNVSPFGHGPCFEKDEKYGKHIGYINDGKTDGVVYDRIGGSNVVSFIETYRGAKNGAILSIDTDKHNSFYSYYVNNKKQKNFVSYIHKDATYLVSSAKYEDPCLVDQIVLDKNCDIIINIGYDTKYKSCQKTITYKFGEK